MNSNLKNEVRELIESLCGLKKSEAAWIAKVLEEELYFEIWSIAKSQGQEQAVKLLASSTSDFFQNPKEVFQKLLEIKETEELLQQQKEEKRLQKLRKSQQNKMRQRQQQEIEETEILLRCLERELQIETKKRERLLQELQRTQQSQYLKQRKQRDIEMLSGEPPIFSEILVVLNNLPPITWQLEHFDELLASAVELKSSLNVNLIVQQLMENREKKQSLNTQDQQHLNRATQQIKEKFEESEKLTERLRIMLQALEERSLEHPQPAYMKEKQPYLQNLQEQIQQIKEHLQILEGQIQQTREKLEELQEDYKAQVHLQQLRKTQQVEEYNRLRQAIQKTEELFQQQWANLDREYGSTP